MNFISFQNKLFRVFIFILLLSISLESLDWYFNSHPTKQAILNYACRMATSILNRGVFNDEAAKIMLVSKGPGLSAVLNLVVGFPFEKISQTKENEDIFGLIYHALAHFILIEEEYKQRRLNPGGPISTRPTLVILGHPGTGSTVLQTMMSLDPNARTVHQFETLAPVTSMGTREQRIAYVMESYNYNREKAVTAPAECSSIMEFALSKAHVQTIDSHLSAFLPILEWSNTAAVTRQMYDFHRRYLQLLNAQLGRNDEAHWVLKDPMHTIHMDLLLNSFPDAKIIWTHRKLDEMLRTGWARKEKVFNPMNFLLSSALCSRIGMRERDRVNDESRFKDVYFEDLQADPVDVVREIYRHFGMIVCPEHEARMQEWWTLHQRAPQHYDIQLSEVLGQSEANIYKHFGPYIARFPRVQP